MSHVPDTNKWWWWCTCLW